MTNQLKNRIITRIINSGLNSKEKKNLQEFIDNQKTKGLVSILVMFNDDQKTIKLFNDFVCRLKSDELDPETLSTDEIQEILTDILDQDKYNLVK